MRRNGRAGQKAFLAAYAACGQITAAAKAAGIDRSAHYEWKQQPGYMERFNAADEQAGDVLVDAATVRANDGILQAEWYQGKIVGSKRVYSDGLMMFLIRGKKKEYRQGAIELTGPQGGPIAVSLADVLRERKKKREETQP